MVIKVGREPDLATRIRQRQGSNLRRIRKLKKITIAEFAEALQVTDASVTHWERGRYTPRPAMQVKIADLLDVPWSMLFGLDQETAA